MSKPKKNRIDENYMRKFGMLVEYNYIPEVESENNLLFSSSSSVIEEDEEDELGPEDFGIEPEEGEFGEPEEGEFGEPEEGEFGEPEEGEFGEDEPEEDIEVTEDGVELDVTDIVKNSEEAKEISTAALEKIDTILSNFSELETRLGGFEEISSKIDSLEQEIEKRNPTNVEKMEMRSLDSYPYNLKLTDFWSEKEGYDVSTPTERTDKGDVEYKLTDEIIDSTYDEGEAKESFNDDDEENNM
jgi:hypothetical protein